MADKKDIKTVETVAEKEAANKLKAEKAKAKADKEAADKLEAEKAKAKAEYEAADSEVEGMSNRELASFKQQGEDILSRHPEASEVFLTSNQFGFFRYQDASNHAASLKNKRVITIKRN